MMKHEQANQQAKDNQYESRLVSESNPLWNKFYLPRVVDVGQYLSILLRIEPQFQTDEKTSGANQ
ncbi:hypothetical protein EON80_28150 [bacterium]|nr:MAG: hypothetical protein EON80_28150 [bacterium]